MKTLYEKPFNKAMYPYGESIVKIETSVYV